MGQTLAEGISTKTACAKRLLIILKKYNNLYIPQRINSMKVN